MNRNDFDPFVLMVLAMLVLTTGGMYLAAWMGVVLSQVHPR